MKIINPLYFQQDFKKHIFNVRKYLEAVLIIWRILAEYFNSVDIITTQFTWVIFSLQCEKLIEKRIYKH